MNILETVRKTFTKLSGFLEVIPSIPFAKYGGDLTTQFWGKGWESWNFDPSYLQNGRSAELEIFCAIGGLRALELMQCRTRAAIELSRTRRSSDDRYYYEMPEFDSVHAECMHKLASTGCFSLWQKKLSCCWDACAIRGEGGSVFMKNYKREMRVRSQESCNV